VPNWAYLDIPAVRSSHRPFPLPSPFTFSPQSGYWNATAAQVIGGAYFDNEPHLICILNSATDSPEVTGSASVSSSLVGGGTTTTPKITSPVSSSSHSSSNTGAIAGGVVGGIIGVALITGFVAWFTIRRRRARSPRPPSVEYFGGQESEMGVAALVPYPPNIGRKLYVSPFFTPNHVQVYKSVIDRLIAFPGPFGSKHISYDCTFPNDQCDGIK
jgi:hypothetical protein